jgi:hypothetical protein
LRNDAWIVCVPHTVSAVVTKKGGLDSKLRSASHERGVLADVGCAIDNTVEDLSSHL